MWPCLSFFCLSQTGPSLDDCGHVRTFADHFFPINWKRFPFPLNHKTHDPLGLARPEGSLRLLINLTQDCYGSGSFHLSSCALLVLIWRSSHTEWNESSISSNCQTSTCFISLVGMYTFIRYFKWYSFVWYCDTTWNYVTFYREHVGKDCIGAVCLCVCV